MKKILITSLLFAVVSCGLGEKKDHKLEQVGLTVTVPGDTYIINTKPSEYLLPESEYTLGKTRISVKQIEEGKFPDNVEMLETALKSASEFKSVIEKKTLPNGAFGIVFEKTDHGKVEKDYLFYFTNGQHFFKITPIGNSKGKYFGENVASIGTLK